MYDTIHIEVEVVEFFAVGIGVGGVYWLLVSGAESVFCGGEMEMGRGGGGGEGL